MSSHNVVRAAFHALVAISRSLSTAARSATTTEGVFRGGGGGLQCGKAGFDFAHPCGLRGVLAIRLPEFLVEGFEPPDDVLEVNPRVPRPRGKRHLRPPIVVDHAHATHCSLLCSHPRVAPYISALRASNV